MYFEVCVCVYLHVLSVFDLGNEEDKEDEDEPELINKKKPSLPATPDNRLLKQAAKKRKGL